MRIVGLATSSSTIRSSMMAGRSTIIRTTRRTGTLADRTDEALSWSPRAMTTTRPNITATRATKMVTVAQPGIHNTSMADPSSIGPAMAVALLTTLYGAVIANLICLPLSDKLALRSQHEQVNKNIILEAAVGISRGVSPLVLEESLKIYLSPKDRRKVNDKNETEAGEPA